MKNIQSQKDAMELVEILTAISVVSNRLATSIAYKAEMDKQGAGQLSAFCTSLAFVNNKNKNGGK